ncbi:DUF2255 family protein [Phytohabitans rumicis]|uniref:DUF2255 domain-containing protein n=1 Tax=Phytohabitans rumicis TaxID=1076125 RepID=A0A6V8KTL2_9ACTN|nr:DUF2255 family protein [Phytohabitans rumicis]GFJ88453.1 hypothetical protein Prum_020950 [Phytohabitans rumicis]
MDWDAQTFDELAAVRDLDIVVPAPGHDTIRTPIWVVPLGEHLYVRSWKGQEGRWYRRARRHGSGAVVTSGGERGVRFVPVTDAALDAAIDREYLAKYGDTSPAQAMVRPPVSGTTLRLVPA